MDNTKNLLAIDNLHVQFNTYLGEIKAVRGVSFSLKQGEILAIVGESGCGKSVTAQSILQLLPSPPSQVTQGSILFEGEELLKKSKKGMESIRGKDISMIFQDPMTSLNPTMKVGKQITECLFKHSTISKDDAYKKALDLLKKVKIPQEKKRFEQYPHEFSGGMRQRVMIAIALSCNPKLLIADEPTTALDVTIQSQILDLLKELQEQMNMSIILITHDLGIVAQMCKKISVMYAGQIIETGSTEQIFYNPQHPYTKGLLSSIPVIPLDKTQPLTPIKGSPPNLLYPPKGCSFTQRCPYAMNICPNKQPHLIYTKDHSQATACWLHHPHAKQQLSTFEKHCPINPVLEQV